MPEPGFDSSCFVKSNSLALAVSPPSESRSFEDNDDYNPLKWSIAISNPSQRWRLLAQLQGWLTAEVLYLQMAHKLSWSTEAGNSDIAFLLS